MKVLHYQHNGAGVIISAGLRKIGVWSLVAATGPHPYGFKEDVLVKGPDELLQFDGFDILHSHSELRLPTQVAERYAGRLVQHYHDAMMGKIERFRNLKTAVLGAKRFNLYRDSMNFVSTPNIIEFVEDATFVPLPVNTESFVPARLSGEPLTIGFNASTLDKRKKRFLVTEEVVEAAERLRLKGVQVELKPQPTNITHDQMHDAYWKHIDVWVDRFGLDFYGFSSVEAAACGIPVVCQIGEAELSYVPKCPFVNTTSSELVDALVNTDFLDRKLKKAHRDFAVEVHDFAKVATLCRNKYGELL